MFKVSRDFLKAESNLVDARSTRTELPMQRISLSFTQSFKSLRNANNSADAAMNGKAEVFQGADNF